jgi:NNP family nitrate/nitrite transporter-like MFS transporter
MGGHSVFGLALIPVVLAWVLVWLLAKDTPSHPAPRRLRHYFIRLQTTDAWWFCLFCSVTFGGFVGLASFLNILFHDQYGISQIQSRNYATLCVSAGSFIRPVGGYLADRIGWIQIFLFLYLDVATVMGTMSLLPSLGWRTVLFFSGMGLLGIGNGAAFQLVP